MEVSSRESELNPLWIRVDNVCPPAVSAKGLSVRPRLQELMNQAHKNILLILCLLIYNVAHLALLMNRTRPSTHPSICRALPRHDHLVAKPNQRPHVIRTGTTPRHNAISLNSLHHMNFSTSSPQSLNMTNTRPICYHPYHRHRYGLF